MGGACMRCVENRLAQYEAKYPQAHEMVENWCPTDPAGQLNYLRCFCNTNSNPFAPWPTTTTTTLPLSPAPPLPPPGPTPAPPKPGRPCELSEKCIQGLEAHYAC